MDRYSIPSVFQAIQLCEILALSDDGMRAADIEHALKVPRTTVFRLLRTLLGERVIEKKGTRYIFGRRVYEVNATDYSRRRAQHELTDPLATLIRNHQCSALICIPSEACALTVDVIDASLSHVCPIRSGTPLSLIDSAPGQIVLAYLPSVTERHIFSRSHENNKEAMSWALKKRAQVCTRGFALTHCKEKNSTQIAVPVFAVNGEFSAVLSLYFSEKLVDVARIVQWSQKLKAVACASCQSFRRDKSKLI